MSVYQRIDHQSYFQRYGIHFETRQTFFVDDGYRIWDAGFAKSLRRRDVYRPEDCTFADVDEICDRFNELVAPANPPMPPNFSQARNPKTIPLRFRRATG